MAQPVGSNLSLPVQPQFGSHFPIQAANPWGFPLLKHPLGEAMESQELQHYCPHQVAPDFPLALALVAVATVCAPQPPQQSL